MDGEQNQISKGIPQSASAEPNVMGKQAATPSSLEQFEKIVDRAHREIEGVRNVYMWLAGILGIILATGIGLATYLTYNNFRDMRSDMKDTVVDISSRVNKRIDDEFNKESIQDLIQKKAEEKVSQVADRIINDYVTRTLKPQLDMFDTRISATESKLKTLESEALAELRQTSEYVLTVAAAQNDDRKAYDQLTKWANDKTSPFSERAAKAREKIQDEHTSPFTFTYNLQWPQGVDPSKLSFDRLKATFSAATPQNRTSLINFIWDRGDIPKKEKMEFLVEVMKSDPSLRVVEQAARCFLGESKQPFKRLATDQMIDWWEKNKNEYKKEDKPKDSPERK